MPRPAHARRAALDLPTPHRRRALVEEAKQLWELAAEGADGCSVRAKLGQGVEAEVRLLSGWPAGSDVLLARCVGPMPPCMRPGLVTSRPSAAAAAALAGIDGLLHCHSGPCAACRH